MFVLESIQVLLVLDVAILLLFTYVKARFR
jgi:hypothetical protein